MRGIGPAPALASAAVVLLSTSPGSGAGQASAGLGSRAEAAEVASGLLVRIATSPDSIALRPRLIELFDRVFIAPLSTNEPLPNTVPGDVLVAVHRWAREGDPLFLGALMRAALGWYGGSGEGGEWINEMLWETLEVQPQLTLNVLADLPPPIRRELIDGWYTRPIHDGFDFATILAGLRSAEVPPGMEADVARIIAVIEP